MSIFSYKLINHDLLLTEGKKYYTLRLRDLPDNQKPREKLLAEGPGCLSVQELLSIILITGTRKEEVLSMTTRIINEYGEQNILSITSAKTLSDNFDIPISKASQIVACGELGRRFFKRSHNGAPVIRTTRDVYEYVVEMRSLSKEHLRGIYLNIHYQVVHDETISIGTVDANLIHAREVFRPALTYSAVGLILVHNHPSGVVIPSEEDLMTTKQISNAGLLLGIELIDHVVVGRDGFISINDY
jgi:DNA repair protein RadC